MTQLEPPTADRARNFWERNAKNYDRSMAILGGPIPQMVELTGETIRGASRVLEVAAGTGLVTGALARGAREIVATDYAKAMVEKLEARVRAEGHANVRCEQADIYNLQYGNGAFDAVVAANVLHLVPDLRGALSALRAVLKPGGKLIVPTYCHDETAVSWAISRLMAVTGFPGQRRFTANSLRHAVEAAGLKVQRHQTLRGLIPIEFVECTGTTAS